MPNADPTATPITAYLQDESFDFVDASQVTSRNITNGVGGVVAIAQNTTALMQNWYRDQHFFGVKPITIAKIYCRDRVALWSKFTSGAASTRYHRPHNEVSGRRSTPDAFQDINNLMRFVKEVPFVQMRPHLKAKAQGEFLLNRMSGGSPRVIVLYLTDPKNGSNAGGGVSFAAKPGKYSVVFYSPEQGEFTLKTESVVSEGKRQIRITAPPFERDLAVLIKEMK
jgi:hypothetical protein